MNSIDKNSRNCWLLAFLFLALAAANSLPAADITGKVRDAGADNATVVIDGDASPAVGDSAEIFFKIPGADEEISVASGTVAAVDAKVVKIKIEKATGTIAKDQLARIKSGSSPQGPGVSPASESSPSGTAAAGSSIIGDWVSHHSVDGNISLSFKADGSLLWVAEDAQHGTSMLAKYRIDPSTKPQGLEVDFEEGPMKGGELRGIFELQSDGRLKLEFGEEPLKEFTKNAQVFSRATSPVVRSSKPAKPALPTPTPDQAPPTPPDEALVREAMQRDERGDYAGACEAAEKAIALNPKNASAFFWRGSCFRQKEDWAAAIAAYEKAMELDPSKKLQDLIDKTKAVLDSERARATPSPARARAKTKRKP